MEAVPGLAVLLLACVGFMTLVGQAARLARRGLALVSSRRRPPVE